MDHSTQRQLEIFAQMVASGSLKECARDLALPAATVEQELGALENRLGYQLFTRNADGFDLTAVGRSAVSALETLATSPAEQWAVPPPDPAPLEKHHWAEDETADVLLAPPETESPEQGDDVQGAAIGADHAEDSATILPPRSFRPLPKPSGHAPDEPVRNIALAAHPAIFSHFQEALSAFEAASPDIGITLRLEPLTDSEAPALLEQGLADIAWFYAGGPINGVESRYAWSERISLFIGEGHALAGADSVVADDMAGVPYLALSPANPVRRLTEAALAGAGLSCPPATMESDNLYELMRQVQHGRGWFAAFGPMARDFGKMRAITRVPYAQGLPQVEVRQAVRAGLEDDPAIAALAEYLFR